MKQKSYKEGQREIKGQHRKKQQKRGTWNYSENQTADVVATGEEALSQSTVPSCGVLAGRPAALSS